MTSSLDMIRGRSNVVTLTNSSGGALVAGDVCILNTGADESATTTTSANSVSKVYIAAESIAGGATGKFYSAGYCPLVTPSASVTRGRYLFTHTVAKQAAESATYGAGAFGVILKSGTTPSVWLFGSTAQGTGGGGDVATDAIWDAAGDLVQGTGANTAARLAIGTANQMLRVNSGATAVEWSGPLVSAKYKKTSNTTTTSTTMVDADGTNWAFTLTTGAHRCMVGFVGTVINSAANDISALDVSIDGTDQGDATYGLTFWRDSGGNNVNLSFTYLTDVLSAASHTFKLRMAAVGGGTMTINGTGPSALFWVAETLLT